VARPHVNAGVHGMQEKLTGPPVSHIVQAPSIRKDTMPLQLNRIILYSKDVEETVGFYRTHFGFEPHREDGDRIIELINPDGGARLMIHAAGKAQKKGQSTVKLVFDIKDVEAFKRKCLADGLDFGPLHQANGYVFANAHDPGGNPISISSRAFRHE
jgi:catechol 2,3-dioxygenase-like lactoylglutathione lyase family enzyme